MLLHACTDPNYLSSILFSKRFIEIVGIIVPLILVISIAVTLFKVVVDSELKDSKKYTKRIYSKMIAAIVIFFIPTFVDTLFNSIGAPGLTSSECWENANVSTIETYRSVEKQKEEAEKNKTDQEKAKAEQNRKVVKATREAARAKNEKENEKAQEEALAAAEEVSWNSTGTASATAAELIRVAESKVGISGRPNEITRAYGAIGGSYSYPWCAAFVWYCSSLSGVYPAKVTLKSAAVAGYINYFKQKGQFQKSAAHGGNYIPKMGDYIMFSWSGNPNGSDHIGIVKSVSGNEVIYIDGNHSNSVVDNVSRSLNDRNIVGYGVWE